MSEASTCGTTDDLLIKRMQLLIPRPRTTSPFLRTLKLENLLEFIYYKGIRTVIVLFPVTCVFLTVFFKLFVCLCVCMYPLSSLYVSISYYTIGLRYIVEILPIRRKTLYNQLINLLSLKIVDSDWLREYYTFK